MIITYFIILLLAIFGLKKRTVVSGNEYIERSQAAMIKGIFVLLVFASHVSHYFDSQILPPGVLSESVWNSSFVAARNFLGQWVVIPFFFYSGYGIRRSIDSKGAPYIRRMPKHRILRTWVHTALILLLFFLPKLFFGEHYSLKRIVLSFLLWDSFGNSNWYMFAILFLYLFTYLSFRLIKRTKLAVILCCILTFVYYLVLSYVKEAWWYDTVFVYCFGLIWPELEPYFLKLGKKPVVYGAVLLGLLAVIILGRNWSIAVLKLGGVIENLKAILVMLLINLILLRVRIGNPILEWLGNHVFEIYLLQRLPMILFAKFGLARHIAVFIIACFAATVFLSFLCEKVMRQVDKKLFA